MMSSPQNTLDPAPGAEVTEWDTQPDQSAEASEEGEQSSQGPFLSMLLVPGPMTTHMPEGLKAELLLLLLLSRFSRVRLCARSPSPRAWRPDFPGAAREAP